MIPPPKLMHPLPWGAEGIRRCTQTLTILTTAIGGITVQDLPELPPYVHNVAVVSAIAAAKNPYRAPKELVDEYERSCIKKAH